MPEQKIYYRRVRDLSAIFNATFAFLRQNFAAFFGSILLYAGPFLLIGVIVSAVMLRSVTSLAAIGSFAYALKDLFGIYFMVIVIFSIGASVYNVILSKNVIENEKLAEHESLTIRQAGANFFDDYWRVLGNMILLSLTVIAAMAVLVMTVAGIFSISGGTAGLGIPLAILFFLLLFMLLPMLAYIPLVALFVCQRDKVSIFEAIGKVLHYLKGNFWSTWLVSFIALLCYVVMAMFAQIPVYIITFITSFSRIKSTIGYGVAEESTPILLIVITAVCSLISYAVVSVYYLMNIYQYTSLEEKKEGSAMLDKINQIQ